MGSLNLWITVLTGYKIIMKRKPCNYCIGKAVPPGDSQLLHSLLREFEITCQICWNAMIYKSFNKRDGNRFSSSISHQHTQHPEECITRQIISLNKSALMIGSGGSRGCMAGRMMHSASKSFSSSISSGGKIVLCPCWQGGRPCSNSPKIKWPHVLCGRRLECYNPAFSKADKN